jgi:ABC-2 type transport system ATP-binding protein
LVHPLAAGQRAAILTGASMSEPLLVVEELSKTYRRAGASITAVDAVSFRAHPNEVVGLLGANGAGKTTTIKCICGLVTPSRGAVRIGGIDALACRRSALERVAAVLEGSRNLYWRLSPRENLEFFAGLHGLLPSHVRSRIEALLERFDLARHARAPTFTLSRGNQQRLTVACALVKQTQVLILDEPTLGLDVEAAHDLRKIVRQLVREESRTVLLSSHDMASVQEVCDRVVILHGGRVVTDDTVANLLGLMKARAYAISLAGPVAEELRRRLESRFPSLRVGSGRLESRLEVEFLNGHDFYDLFDVLRGGGASVEAIARQDPNLEEVFLRIVREARS